MYKSKRAAKFRDSTGRNSRENDCICQAVNVQVDGSISHAGNVLRDRTVNVSDGVAS